MRLIKFICDRCKKQVWEIETYAGQQVPTVKPFNLFGGREFCDECRAEANVLMDNFYDRD